MTTAPPNQERSSQTPAQETKSSSSAPHEFPAPQQHAGGPSAQQLQLGVPSTSTTPASSAGQGRAWWYAKVDQLSIRQEQLRSRIRDKRREVDNVCDSVAAERKNCGEIEERARELIRKKCVAKGEVESGREAVRKLGMETKAFETDIFNLQRSLNK